MSGREYAKELCEQIRRERALRQRLKCLVNQWIERSAKLQAAAAKELRSGSARMSAEMASDLLGRSSALADAASQLRNAFDVPRGAEEETQCESG